MLERAIGRLLHEQGEAILSLDAFKISHHGSKNNTSPKLLELVDCRRFLISTNGARHDHPAQEASARIVYRNHQSSEPTELYFNHRTEQNAVWDDEELKEEWNYRTHYPPEGNLIEL